MHGRRREAEEEQGEEAADVLFLLVLMSVIGGRSEKERIGLVLAKWKGKHGEGASMGREENYIRGEGEGERE